MNNEVIVNLNHVVQVITTLLGLFIAWRAYRRAKKDEAAFLLPPLGWLLAGAVASVSGITILVFLLVFGLRREIGRKKTLLAEGSAAPETAAGSSQDISR